MSVDFEKVFHDLNPQPGMLRLQQAGLGWKSDDKGSLVTVAAGDMKWMQWIRVARNFQLRIGLKNDRRRETFDGLMREDFDRLSKAVKDFYGITLETKEISIKGWNWGKTDFQGSDLAFQVSGRTMFELPLRNIANSNIASKTEVSLEFVDPTASAEGAPTSSSSKSRRADELVEMRFYIPGTVKAGSDAGSDAGGGEEDEEVTAAQAFHDQIKDKAEIGQVSGEGLVVFNEVLVVTPRGRYDVDMFPTFLRLRGKTYDYKILYSSITRMFLLPKPDEIHLQLVVGLDPPIRQGQTRYPYLVMQFAKDEEMDAELNMEEDAIKEKYGDRLLKRYDAPTFEVVSSVFRGLSGKDIITPKSFRSHNGQYAIKCNVKAVQGDLYILEKSLIFVAKQPVHVPFNDIHQAIFSRVGGAVSSGKTFDLNIVTKSGPEHTFMSLNREEHQPLEDFFRSHKVRIKNEMQDGDLLGAPAMLSDDDEDEDVEMESDEDAGRKKPKARAPAAAGGAAMDEDEDESEDEDFQASSSDGGSPSESESDEEGSDAGGGSDVEMEEAPKKKAPKKSSGNGEGPPKKKAKRDD